MSRVVLALATAFALTSPAVAEPQHGIAMYGEPALPPDFAHLPYANPAAPQGGAIIYGEASTFDSLNPFIQRGRAPWGVRAHTVESLMGRNYDEPFALYGLLAESVETGPNREWVEFTLNPAARFSDGSPVTVEDVVWSMQILGEEGHGRYRAAWDGVESWEQTGERSVRFNLTGENLELPLILAMRPILKKGDWDDRDFTASNLDPFVASGPYTVGAFEPGRFIEFDRNPDYWGNELGFNRGRHNFETIRYEFFGNGDAAWQGFTSGETNMRVEWDAARWATEYDFPRAERGEVVLSEVPHQRPTGMEGFVMNTRRDIFADIRVRDAMIHAFNFEWINGRLNEGLPERITSYFSNSQLAFEGEATGLERELLEPFADTLPADVFEAYALPEGDDDVRNRRNLRTAQRLLADAGWTLQNGALVNEAGTPFAFEILLGASENEPVANIYADALGRLGMDVTITLVDSAQYTERLLDYDYDMVPITWRMSLSPGTEQRLYWGSDGVTEQGSRNYMGVDSPAVDALIENLIDAGSEEEFLATTRALDRVLTTGRYVVPFWHTPVTLVAHGAELHYPEELPIYGYWIGFAPDVWWYEAN
ncbi:ABC transporter substrate-binding protein [Pontivivens ytuae]|uniref:ABC transporter substrate-binding protein n=1 Tax=Pontivivens ytuae TaxID=2789856 RepID=A0A7S9LSJ1_9RHOB|nr:ABC transporter substrate-binding protein [Pontivivens ytuae]